MTGPIKRTPQENDEIKELKAKIEELEKAVLAILQCEKEKEKHYEDEFMPAGTYLGQVTF